MKKLHKAAGSDYPCPACDCSHTTVVDSRLSGRSKRRRRKCECGESFTTFEVEDTALGDIMEKAKLFDRIQALTGSVG